MPAWYPPDGVLGALDLRSNTKAGVADDPDPGYGLFVLPAQRTISGARYLGQDLQGHLRAADRDFLASIGLPVTETQVLAAIRQIFADSAIYDPAGLTAPKPVRIGRRQGFEIRLGGFGRIVGERFTQVHTAFQATLDVRKADFIRMANAGVPLEALERWTGYDALKLFRRDPATDISDLLPALLPDDGDLPEAYRGSGWRAPTTTIADAFTNSDGTQLADHSGGGFNWSEVGGNTQIQSNTAEFQGKGLPVNEGRADSNLSSDDHYGQVEVVKLESPPSSNTNAGVSVRYSSSSNDHYYISAYENSSGDYLLVFWKVVSGVYSGLDSNQTISKALPDTLKGEVDGSSMKSYYNGTLEHDFTDTAISGNLRGGITSFISTGGSAGDTAVDNFVAADLAAGLTEGEIVAAVAGGKVVLPRRLSPVMIPF